MKMTFQEIRIIATGPSIANQLRDVNTICRMIDNVIVNRKRDKKSSNDGQDTTQQTKD